MAARQVKQSDSQCCTDYLIYALSKLVRLPRTLRGGQFMGADTDLDGRVEIRAEDRAAIDALDGPLRAGSAIRQRTSCASSQDSCWMPAQLFMTISIKSSPKSAAV